MSTTPVQWNRIQAAWVPYNTYPFVFGNPKSNVLHLTPWMLQIKINHYNAKITYVTLRSMKRHDHDCWCYNKDITYSLMIDPATPTAITLNALTICPLLDDITVYKPWGWEKQKLSVKILFAKCLKPTQVTKATYRVSKTCLNSWEHKNLSMWFWCNPAAIRPPVIDAICSNCS